MLLAPETDSDSAWKIAERVRAQVKQYRRILEGEEVGITLSVGIVSYPAHASMISELLRRADEAMYSAKRSGKDRSCVFPA
jgi:diguanylate cyclase (GGDEF)-like protein